LTWPANPTSSTSREASEAPRFPREAVPLLNQAS
jgi:hypothetical protein